MDHVTTPTILRLAVDADRAELERLSANPRTEVIDTIEAQLCQLVQTRSPDRTLAPDEARSVAAGLVGPMPQTSYGVWVHYPWSHRLVHLLDAEEFIELRTSRNRYLITAQEQAELARKRIGIVGLSVGQSVAMAIALERSAGELRLADFDTLDLSNLNRLRGGVHDLGLPKAVIAARAIAELDPYLEVRCFLDGLTNANEARFFRLGGKLDLVIDECDGLDMKVRLREKARELGIPVVMQTSDRGLLDIERFDCEPGRPFFHGLAGDLRASDLVGLSTEDKVPPLMKIIGVEGLSTRIRASLLEVERSIRTWPQLGSAVTLGGGLAADAARRVLLGQLRASGRFYVDLAELVRDAPPAAARTEPLVSEALVRKLVGRATLAPSGGNHQPWKWTARGSQLELHEDPAHRMGFTDFDNLGTAIALGAATENLVLAAHAEGLEVKTVLHEQPGELRIVFELGAAEPNEGREHDALARQIEHRRTDRRRVPARPLSGPQWEDLRVAARSVSGVELTLVTEGPKIEALAKLIGQGDRLRMLDPELRREMFSELRWTAEEGASTGDGLEVSSLHLSPVDRTGLELCRSSEAVSLVGEWGLGEGLERLGRRWAASSSALGLLTVSPGDRVGYFRAGRAFQRLWLTATRDELALHPLTFLPFALARLLRGEGVGLAPATVQGLQELRPEYARLLGLKESTREVVLFRLFPAMGMVPAPVRRSLDTVLRLERA